MISIGEGEDWKGVEAPPKTDAVVPGICPWTGGNDKDAAHCDPSLMMRTSL